MSNDLIELTDTELDTVSGGKHGLFALNFGNIVTQVNYADVTGAVVSMGGAGSTAALTQTTTQTGTIGSVSGPNFTGNPVFSGINF
jgi:bacteriocin-like protein